MTDSSDISGFDPLDLRRAFGVFATGVTVVTTVDGEGKVHGFTANSFSSVSIDPPLLLVSIAKSSYGLPIFTASQVFAVNILAEKQRDLSNRFATRGIDKFAETPWRAERTGAPILEQVAAWFDCETHQQVEAGDHVILIGKVLEYGHNSDSPLGFCRGAYVSYGLTPQMLQLVSSDGQLRVGALVECEGRILLQQDVDSGELGIPVADRVGDVEDPGSLLGMLAEAGIETDLPFLFSAYHVSNTRYVYYRGEVKSSVDIVETPGLHFVEFDEIPWSSIRDYAVRRILKRYRNERSIGNYSVYIGGKDMGEVYDDNAVKPPRKIEKRNQGSAMRIKKNSAALMMLGMEHKRFDQVLGILETQVRLAEDGEAADFKLIDLAVEYFLTFPDTCHHPKEDLLFARVMQRTPDDSGVVGDLIGEHKELSEITHRTRDELAAREGREELSDEALNTLKSFIRIYRRHLAEENENFFPYVLENFTQEEFDMIDFDLFDSADPVYDRAAEGRFARLRDEILSLGGKAPR